MLPPLAKVTLIWKAVEVKGAVAVKRRVESICCPLEVEMVPAIPLVIEGLLKSEGNTDMGPVPSLAVMLHVIVSETCTSVADRLSVPTQASVDAVVGMPT